MHSRPKHFVSPRAGDHPPSFKLPQGRSAFALRNEQITPPTDADGMVRIGHRLMRCVLGSDTETVGHKEVFRGDRRVERQIPGHGAGRLKKEFIEHRKPGPLRARSNFKGFASKLAWWC